MKEIIERVVFQSWKEYAENSNKLKNVMNEKNIDIDLLEDVICSYNKFIIEKLKTQ